MLLPIADKKGKQAAAKQPSEQAAVRKGQANSCGNF